MRELVEIPEEVSVGDGDFGDLLLLWTGIIIGLFVGLQCTLSVKAHQKEQFICPSYEKTHP